MTIDRRFITAVVFVIAICGAVPSSMGQETSAPRTQLPAAIEYHGDMAYMLANLPVVYGATIGLEVDPRQPRPQVRFDVRDPTLADVLDAMMKSAPSYQWRDNGGFIEVLPLKGSNPLLDTIVSKFRVDDVDERAAIDQLMRLPEVQAGMAATSLNGLDPGDASKEKIGKKFSLSLENMTLRQALSRVAKENGTRFWIFRREANGRFSIRNSP